MWSTALRRICGLLVIAAYAVSTVVAAASALAACPALDHARHAAHPEALKHTHHHHDDGSRSRPGDCLNCCIGTCLLGASLPAPTNGGLSPAFYGTLVVYASKQAVLSSRSIPPDTGPPKPIT